MQQTTINLPSTHPVRALTGLARQIALPAEFAPERFPSFPALERTAVMGFSQPTSLACAAANPTRVMITRQASYPCWADTPVTAGVYQAQWGTSSPAGTSTSNDWIVDSFISWRAVAGIPANTQPGVSGAVPAPVGYVPLGVDNSVGQLPFIFVPGGANVYFCVGGVTASANLMTGQFTFEVWSSPGETRVIADPLNIQATNLTGSTGNYTPSVAGYWVRPKLYQGSSSSQTLVPFIVTATVILGGTATFTPSVSTQGNYSVTGAAGNFFLPLTYPAEFVNSRLPWYSTRLTAVAALFTNVSQVLNKAGTVLAGRVSPQVASPWAVDSNYLNSLHPAEKAFLPLETGFYTYAPPSTDLSDFWDYTLNTSGAPWGTPSPAPVYRLDNTSLVNIAYFTAGSVAETLAVTVSWHLEFRTSSALFQIALSGVQLETLHQAQLALARAGFFFENPTHSAILQRVISAAKAIAPYAAGALSIAFPGAARVSQAMLAAARTAKRSRGGKKKGGKKTITVAKNPTHVPPTSAQKSGIVGPTRKKSGIDYFFDKYPQHKPKPKK